jgi:hypothetical protein
MACSVFAELNASADRVATKVKGGGGGSGSSSTVGYAALQGEGAAVGVDAESGGDCRASKSGPTHETSVIEKNADVSKTSSIYGNAEAEAEVARVAIMDVVVNRQAAVTATFYVLVGMGGYLQFGDAAGGGGGSVLNLYVSADGDGDEEEEEQEIDVLIDLARLALSAVVALSFPIIHFTSRVMLHDLCCAAGQSLGCFSAAAGSSAGEASVTAVAAVRGAGNGKRSERASESERVPLADGHGGGAGGGEGGELSGRVSERVSVDAPQLMSRSARWLLTLSFWWSCTAFALAGYELGFIFAVFGSTCSVSTMLFVPGLLLLDEGGPWRHAGYRRASLCGWRHGYGGERRRVIGYSMLGCGVGTCGASLALIFELI